MKNQPPSPDCQAELTSLQEEFEAFAYIVSHDLKAPVRAATNLTTWIEEDLEGKLNEETSGHFNLLKNRLSRLDLMIQALLEYSRATRRNLEIGPVNVENCLKESEMKAAGIRPFRLQVAGHLPELQTYQHKFSAVLDQLLKNAVFFNDKPEPEIQVLLEELPELVRISISDNGPGIPENSREKLFDMFYTVQSKDSLETTGAGLAIVRKIINFVKGNLTVENAPNGGAVFTFTWPKKLPEIANSQIH